MKIKNVKAGIRDGVSEILGGDMTEGEVDVALVGTVVTSGGLFIMGTANMVGTAMVSKAVVATAPMTIGAAKSIIACSHAAIIGKGIAIAGVAVMAGAFGKAFLRGFTGGYNHAALQDALHAEEASKVPVDQWHPNGNRSEGEGT